MNVLYGLLTAIFLSSENIFDKYIMRVRKIHTTHFITMVFLFAAIFLSPFLFFLEINPLVFQAKYIFLLVSLILLAVSYNYLWFKPLTKLPVETFQPIFQFNFVASIIIAVLLFPSERNYFDVILALIAVCSIIWMQYSKKHFIINNYVLMVFFCSILVGIHTIVATQLLEVYSPLLLYTVRSVLCGFIFLAIFRIERDDFSEKKVSAYIIHTFIVIFETLFYYLALQNSGVVLTSILISLAPIITIWFSHIFLGEKIHTKNVIATIIITTCVILAVVY